MDNRKGTRTSSENRSALLLPIFYFLFSIFWLSDGCGAPGEPIPRMPPVPAAIKDLAVRQAGDSVELTFTLPANSVSGEKLAASPAVEILRGSLTLGGAVDLKSLRVVYTIPGALVDNYRTDGRVRFNDPVAPEEARSHSGATVAYIVRTRASQKRASADSNAVSLRIFPVPAPIASVKARVTESAVELIWPVPVRTAAGEPAPAITGYRVYRSEIHPSAPSLSPEDLPQGKPESHVALPASSESNNYRDTSVVFDLTYVYIVRSV